MPDITMCKGEDCPKKEECYRFLAKPSGLQSWFANPPFNKELKKCGFFWQRDTPEENKSIHRDGKCHKHNLPLEEVECSCQNGYTESDDSFEDKLVQCWKCRGTGVSPFGECYLCNEEYFEEEET